MGTNYYIKSNHCEKCDRFNRLHIGKSSSGWKFLFKSHVKNENTPELMSLNQWIEFLTDPDNEILDEYNENVNFKDFLKIIVGNSDWNTRSHTESADDRIYLDPEGFEFSENEFS